MNDSSSTPDSKDLFLASFARELERSLQRDEVIRRYCEERPELAERLRGLAGMNLVLDEAVASPDEPRPPERLGEFRIFRRIGRGGMGEIYEAMQESLVRRVAVKVIRRGRVSPEARERFLREQEVLANLHQTHIVPIHTAGEEGNIQYFAMPYIEGAALHHVIRSAYLTAMAPRGKVPTLRELASQVAKQSREKSTAKSPEKAEETVNRATEDYRLPEYSQLMPLVADPPPGAQVRLSAEYFRSVAEVMIDVAGAVQHAHVAGYIHRDLKPSNLMIDLAGQSWVIDFGLAGLLAANHGTNEWAGHAGSASNGLTAEHMLGTINYMAPEQVRGMADARSDVWGLGATLYELCTLRQAFDGAAGDKVLSRIQTEAPRRLRDLVSNVPEDLAAICGKALRKDPRERYQAAGAFADDLRRWLDGRLPAVQSGWRQAPRALGLWTRRNVAWTVTGLVAIVLIAGATAWGFDRLEKKRDEAEQQRDRIDRQRRFERALRQAQEALLTTPHPAGWSRDVAEQLQKVLHIDPNADIRDTAVASFAGLDAVPIQVYDLPWQPETPMPLGLSHVVYSPDSGRLLAGGWQHRSGLLSPALLWGPNTANKPTKSTLPGAGPVAFPDADSPLQLVLPAKNQRSLTLWNISTNSSVVELPLPGPWTVAAAALSMDARFAAATFAADQKADGKRAAPSTLAWGIDRKRGTAVAKKRYKWPGNATVLAFSPDSRLIAAGSEDGTIVIRSVADGSEVLRFSEGALKITALGFGRDYRRPSGEHPVPAGAIARWQLAVGSHGGGLSVWNLRTRSRVNAFHGSDYAVYGVAFSPDGTTLVTAGRNVPFIWDVASGRSLLRVQRRGGSLRSWTVGVAFSPDGQCLAFGSPTVFSIGGLDVFRLDEDRGIRTYRGLTGVVERVWLSPTGRWVAALAQNWQLGVWNRATGQVAYVWDVAAGMTTDNSALAFAENDSQILFASGERVSRWSLATGERTGVWRVPLGLNDALAVRPGKKPLLVRRDPVGESSMAIRARELGPDGELTELYRLTDIDARQTDNAYLSTDGRYLLVNMARRGTSRLALLYDGRTGKRIPLDPARLPAHVEWGILTDSGAILALDESIGDVTRQHLFRLPDLKRLGVQPQSLPRIDDAGKLGLNYRRTNQPDSGITLYRVGEKQSFVTFDAGRAPSQHANGLSADGRFVF
jgi:serine/threonine protein kinase/WD40 repeat protein